MKQFWKENMHTVLLLILAGLLFILLGRLIARELNEGICTKRLCTETQYGVCAAYFGWEVDETTCTEEMIYIPSVFDSVWEQYNALQKLSGFDLSPYRGQGIKQVTFRVKKFPNAGQAEAFLHLLIKDGTLIGGDCMTPQLDGLMLPLDIRGLD